MDLRTTEVILRYTCPPHNQSGHERNMVSRVGEGRHKSGGAMELGSNATCQPWDRMSVDPRRANQLTKISYDGRRPTSDNPADQDQLEWASTHEWQSSPTSSPPPSPPQGSPPRTVDLGTTGESTEVPRPPMNQLGPGLLPLSQASKSAKIICEPRTVDLRTT